MHTSLGAIYQQRVSDFSFLAALASTASISSVLPTLGLTVSSARERGRLAVALVAHTRRDAMYRRAPWPKQGAQMTPTGRLQIRARFCPS